MSFDHSAGSRELQDRFDTRQLADRLAEVKAHDRFTPEDRQFIAQVDMFFLATVDDAGQPTCSYKGGERQRRLCVNGIARIGFEDPLLSNYAEAQFVVRVEARNIYPNCPRYIHK